MSDLFISDLHLSPERPAVTRAFFHFLETTAREAHSLYILGDLVEAWIGDDDPDELSRSMIRNLKKLSDNGTSVFFQHGNRDFLMGSRFASESGTILLGTYHLMDSSLLLCHGDTLCTDDLSYQRFRRIIRNPLATWCLSHLPLRKRQQLARRLRARSQEANSNKAANIMDVNVHAVTAAMARFGASTLIHGHTHRPGVHLHSFGKRVVLGDWHDHGWYARRDGGDITLHSFPIDGSH